jgi:arylsulfatase A-like enzyme
MNSFKKTFIHLSCLAIAGVALTAWAQPQITTTNKPNVVFMLVDDLGYMDIGANNPKSFYETPNIDALAKRGMRFTDGYAACPVCSPTRASILTGKYPQRTGITDYIGSPQPTDARQPNKMIPAQNNERLALEETTLAEAFKAQGYATFFAGKWHLGSTNFWPENQGFDINIGGCDWGHPKTFFSPYGNPHMEDGPVGELLPDRLAAETAKFIHANKAKPFLAYLSFYSVHTPLMAREDLKKKYEAKAKALTDSGPKWGQERERKVRLIQDHAVYAGMVEAMDEAVGKVMKALDDAGVSSNTIVVFTSDNGGLSTSEGSPTSNTPLRGGKGWPYEGGVREPLIVAAPGVTKAGSISDTVMTSPDFYPTLLDLAGLPATPKQHQDGVSFVTSLRGEKQSRGPIYWHYPHYGNQGGAPCGAVRDGDWKLIEWYEDGSTELFNLANDLSEKNNLATSEPERVKALLEKLRAWRTTVGAKMPAPNPHPTAKPKAKPAA